MDEKTAKRILRNVLRKHYLSIAFLSLFSGMVGVIFVIPALGAKNLINGVAETNPDKIIGYAIAIGCVLFLGILLQTVQRFLAERERAGINITLKNRAYADILAGEYVKTERYHSGELLNRLMADIAEISRDAVNIPTTMSGTVAQTIFLLAALYVFDRIFFCMFFVYAVAMIFIFRLLRHKMMACHEKMMKAAGKSRSFMQETLENSLTVKTYVAERACALESQRLTYEYYKKRQEKNRINTLTATLISLAIGIGIAFATLHFVFQLKNGETDYGTIATTLLLLCEMQRPFFVFTSMGQTLYACKASVKRLVEVMNGKEPEKESTEIFDWVEIRLSEVTFRYPDSENKIFDSVNARINRGNIICITGDSGSGKSTFFKLLTSAYHPTDGKMYFVGPKGDKSLDKQTIGLFAYVQQSDFLISGTIKENLTFFGLEKTEREMKEALKTACAEFVYDLPNGLNTCLKEKGDGLSEGQKQRLSLARAILSGREILLLDEVTSALDCETERKVLENMRNLHGKTCLISTHRKETLKIADEIWRIERGKIKTETL